MYKEENNKHLYVNSSLTVTIMLYFLPTIIFIHAYIHTHTHTHIF